MAVEIGEYRAGSSCATPDVLISLVGDVIGAILLLEKWRWGGFLLATKSVYVGPAESWFLLVFCVETVLIAGGVAWCSTSGIGTRIGQPLRRC